MLYRARKVEPISNARFSQFFNDPDVLSANNVKIEDRMQPPGSPALNFKLIESKPSNIIKVLRERTAPSDFHHTVAQDLKYLIDLYTKLKENQNELINFEVIYSQARLSMLLLPSMYRYHMSIN